MKNNKSIKYGINQRLKNDSLQTGNIDIIEDMDSTNEIMNDLDQVLYQKIYLKIVTQRDDKKNGDNIFTDKQITPQIETHSNEKE